MKTTKIVLAANLLIFCVMIGIFIYGHMADKILYAHIAKPFVAWSFMLFFGSVALRFAELKNLALRLVFVFFMYGVGDISMEMGTAMTPVGIVLFFVGHVFYIMSISYAKDLPTEKDVPSVLQPSSRKILAGVCATVLFAGTTIAVVCVGRANGPFFFCVMAEIYAQLFTTAAIIGSLKWRRASSIILTVIGSYVYAASDICVAAERYITPYWWMPVFVMSTYWIAVVLYALSFFPIMFHVILKQDKEKPKEKEQ